MFGIGLLLDGIGIGLLDFSYRFPYVSRLQDVVRVSAYTFADGVFKRVRD